MGESSRSLPLAATTTKLHVISNSSDNAGGKPNSAEEATPVGNGPDAGAKVENIKESEMAPSGDKSDRKEKMPSNTSRAELLDAEDNRMLLAESKEAPLGWMGWFVRSANNQEQVSR